MPCKAKLEISDREGRKHIYPKISIKSGVENVPTEKFLYENYILPTNERKVRGLAAPSRPLRQCVSLIVFNYF
ncbi:hypothetical protein Hanom_Chr02g00172221 [Helianthus anomalus]